METLTSTVGIATSLPPFSSIFTSSSKEYSCRRFLRCSSSPKRDGNEPDLRSDSNNESINMAPILSNETLSKDAAMGLVLSAANVRGWTTGSGMEGPPVPAGGHSNSQVSTFPWSLFTKSPRRRMRVAFTCNICGQRTTRAINPHAYTDGTVFVQCCGCNAYHKLVDNLNLFHDMKCYVDPSFDPNANANLGLKYFDMDGGGAAGDIFPLS